MHLRQAHAAGDFVLAQTAHDQQEQHLLIAGLEREQGSTDPHRELDSCVFGLIGTDEVAERTRVAVGIRGGMAMIDTHPDYLADERIFSAYARFLERYAYDHTAWQALPREVSAWWRRRDQSWLEHDGTAWRVAGPAELEGRVTFAAGSW